MIHSTFKSKVAKFQVLGVKNFSLEEWNVEDVIRRYKPTYNGISEHCKIADHL